MKKKKGRKEGEGGETERRNKTKNRAHTLYYPKRSRSSSQKRFTANNFCLFSTLLSPSLPPSPSLSLSPAAFFFPSIFRPSRASLFVQPVPRRGCRWLFTRTVPPYCCQGGVGRLGVVYDRVYTSAGKYCRRAPPHDILTKIVSKVKTRGGGIDRYIENSGKLRLIWPPFFINFK